MSELHTNSNYEMMDDQQKLNFLSDFFEDFTQMEDKTYYALKVKQTAEKHSTLSDLEIQTLKNVILDCGISQFSLLFVKFFFFLSVFDDFSLLLLVVNVQILIPW